MNLPSQDSATGRGLKTTAQAGIGTLLLTGLAKLAVDVWNVPGVPEIVVKYLQDNLILIASAVGISSGLTAFVWNLFRPRVETY